MQELIKQLWDIREKSQDYGTKLQGKLVVSSNDPRCACFAMVFNKCTLSIELIGYYNDIWGKQHQVKAKTPEAAMTAVEQLRNENGERCIEQTKMLFIGVLSSIEFCAKQSVKLLSTTPLGKVMGVKGAKKRVYLNDIIQESHKLGIVSTAEKYKWERLIWIRNSVVHNNGIAEADDEYTIDGVTLTLTNGQMVTGKLDTFTNLTRSSLELYREWVNKL